MQAENTLQHTMDQFDRVRLGHTPTPLEELPNLGADLGLSLWVKRDDCTGIGFGGNKVRQLEFYFGEALAQGADTILITGAIQSNFVRTAAAFAARLGMGCHVQLEERVPDVSPTYRNSGNVLLDELLGAVIHSYPEGEDEAGADGALEILADELKKTGKSPYVIHLGADSPPIGALGYVIAALELQAQIKDMPPFDDIIIPSGSSLTHTGLLFGLRALGNQTPVWGVCVRRQEADQRPRVARRLKEIAQMLGIDPPMKESDINLFDGVLKPGYGQLNPAVIEAIRQTARREGLFLDPVYTGKSMAGLKAMAAAGNLSGKRVLFWHTGGTPSLFGYGDQLI